MVERVPGAGLCGPAGGVRAGDSEGGAFRVQAGHTGCRGGRLGEVPTGIRPARNASRPASTALRIADAIISTGSRARVTAEASITPAHPSSIANAASDAVPAPASRITGTRACSVINWKLCGLRIPSPDPIGDPSGMIAAHPTSSSFRASTGSSFVYGSTVNPSSTNVSAASRSSIGSGSSVRSSAITSSLISEVPRASRASRAVNTASPAVKQPAVLGSTRMPSRSRTDSTEPCTEASTRRIATVVSSVPEATSARSRTSRLGAPRCP